MSQTPDRLTAAFDQVKKDVKMLTSLKTYEKMTQNQIIGGLTVLLLVVGVAAGVYLGQTNQETRQQAAYVTCGTGSDSTCPAGTNVLSACTNGGAPGSCQVTNNDGICHCVVSNPTMCREDCIHQGSTPSECTGLPSCPSCKEQCLQSGASAGYCNTLPACSCIPVGQGTNSCLPPGVTNTTSVCCGGGQAVAAPNHYNCQTGLWCGTPCVRAGECTVPGAECCDGSQWVFDNRNPMICTAERTNGTESYCPGSGTGGGTSSPTPTPTQAPGACSSTTVTPDNTCGGGTCGACQRRTGINVSTTTGANCSDICVNDNSCCPNPTTPPNPTNTPRPTNTPVPNTPGQPTNTPVPNATNTPVIAPVCLNVTLNNPASTTPNTPPNIGDAVTLTCSQVSGASRYEFRVKLPNNTYLNVNPSLTTLFVSQQFQITLAGSYNAACRACATVDEASCSPWEN